MAGSGGLVDAKWVGPFVGALADGRQLVPGETVVSIGKDEASSSDYWEPVGGTTGADAAAVSTPATSEGEAR